jgi:hypothetical protein
LLPLLLTTFVRGGAANAAEQDAIVRRRHAAAQREAGDKCVGRLAAVDLGMLVRLVDAAPLEHPACRAFAATMPSAQLLIVPRHP